MPRAHQKAELGWAQEGVTFPEVGVLPPKFYNALAIAW